MPEILENRVKLATEINTRYERSAAWQSMDFYLDDWRAAKKRLDRRIEVLEQLRDARRIEADSGLWGNQEEYDRG